MSNTNKPPAFIIGPLIWCKTCETMSKTDPCDICSNLLDCYDPPSPQVELDGEITVYESSLGFFPFKEQKMLFIVYKEDKNSEIEKHINWHVGEKINHPFLATKEVVSVQADCDELNYIICKFENLPYPRMKRIVVWYGDLAKLIAHNLQSLSFFFRCLRPL